MTGKATADAARAATKTINDALDRQSASLMSPCVVRVAYLPAGESVRWMLTLTAPRRYAAVAKRHGYKPWGKSKGDTCDWVRDCPDGVTLADALREAAHIGSDMSLETKDRPKRSIMDMETALPADPAMRSPPQETDPDKMFLDPAANNLAAKIAKECGIDGCDMFRLLTGVTKTVAGFGESLRPVMAALNIAPEKDADEAVYHASLGCGTFKEYKEAYTRFRDDADWDGDCFNHLFSGLDDDGQCAPAVTLFADGSVALTGTCEGDPDEAWVDKGIALYALKHDESLKGKYGASLVALAHDALLAMNPETDLDTEPGRCHQCGKEAPLTRVADNQRDEVYYGFCKECRDEFCERFEGAWHTITDKNGEISTRDRQLEEHRNVTDDVGDFIIEPVWHSRDATVRCNDKTGRCAALHKCGKSAGDVCTHPKMLVLAANYVVENHGYFPVFKEG